MSNPKARHRKATKKSLDKLIDLLFDNQYILIGRVVTDYLLATNKKYVTAVSAITNKSNRQTILSEIENILDPTFSILKLHFSSAVIADENKIGKVIIFDQSTKVTIYLKIYILEQVKNRTFIDINNIIMTSHTNIQALNCGWSVSELIDTLNKNQFNIKKNFTKPDRPRIQNVANNSEKLSEFVMAQEIVRNRLIRGFRIEDKSNINSIFEPNLIKNLTNSTLTDCPLCLNRFKKYELELHCCQQVICFNCAIKHIDSRYNNSEIPCPFCRGDPFGWNTITKSEVKSTGPRAPRDDYSDSEGEQISFDEELEYTEPVDSTLDEVENMMS